MSLYQEVRPKKFKDVVGQEEAVSILRGFLKRQKRGKRMPPILLTGPSGVGKNTLVYIMANKMECDMDMDFTEIPCGLVEKPLEVVRTIDDTMNTAPVGKCRIYLLDEVQALSRAKFAQQALLKMLEDTPSWVQFFLNTTDPGKLIGAVKTRCKLIPLRALSDKEMKRVIINASKSVSQEEWGPDEVMERIVEVSEGSPRTALIHLEAVLGIDNADEQMKAIVDPIANRFAIDIARAIIKPRAKWTDVAPILLDCTEDPEMIRRLILSYARSVMLKSPKMAGRARTIIYYFEANLFDSGAAGLARMAWDVCNHK